MKLTFGEQVKIILNRKGMTIKELAEQVEAHTGKPMSRQNMTQRLGRDNFQEQDMRMIAEILGCEFMLSIMEPVAMDAVEVEEPKTERVAEVVQETKEKESLHKGIKGYFRKSAPSTKKEEVPGEINPYTRKEYESNSVRMHPKRIGYVQVYNQETHRWIEMTEWAFLGYQERQKKLMGKDYRPPIYLD